jgi:nicotinic acid mononucleotide adenylyltransferase
MKIDEDLCARHSIFFFRFNALAVSSTEIRGRVREGRSIEGRVPGAVAALIRARKLYQG